MARLTVVLSQAPGKHPAKRALEEDLCAALLMESGLADVAIIPNVYDLAPDHTGRLFLDGVKGDIVLVSWHFPRAVFWLLDRMGVKGHAGESQLKPPVDEDEPAPNAREEKGVGASGKIPDRHIYCLDLRDRSKAAPFVEEVRRIAAECRERDAAKVPNNSPALIQLGLTQPEMVPMTAAFSPENLLAPAGRRWYPVIDYSRCTNCMECLDFCLFGVYSTNSLEQIFVENQDQCKKGCPACSRVCPEQAIIFPEYKSAAIAGADTGAVGGLKIDLSRLFGGEEKDAVSQAVLERDRELVADGRQAVGEAVGLPKRQAHVVEGPKDDLDKLMDDLDSLGI